MENVRIYRMPPCRMVSSGRGMFGDGTLEKFEEWFGTRPYSMFPRDFLWFDGQGFIWYYMLNPDEEAPCGFEIVEFPGGLYAVAAGKDDDDESTEAAKRALSDFIDSSSCFERDPDRAELGNIITPPEVSAALGYEQMDYYVPIRIK